MGKKFKCQRNPVASTAKGDWPPTCRKTTPWPASYRSCSRRSLSECSADIRTTTDVGHRCVGEAAPLYPCICIPTNRWGVASTSRMLYFNYDNKKINKKAIEPRCDLVAENGVEQKKSPQGTDLRRWIYMAHTEPWENKRVFNPQTVCWRAGRLWTSLQLETAYWSPRIVALHLVRANLTQTQTMSLKHCYPSVQACASALVHNGFCFKIDFWQPK